MPLPPNSNRFSVLSVDRTVEIDELIEKIQAIQVSESQSVARTFRPWWERCLPTGLIINMLDSEEKREARSLKLKVDLETTDTGEVKSVQALLDSGATGMFIDRDYVKANQLATRALSNPIPLRNVDGTLMKLALSRK